MLHLLASVTGEIEMTNSGSALSGATLMGVIIFGVAVFVVMLIAYTNVIARAGYSRAWILILLVPIANIVFLLIFCFKRWPVQQELDDLRAFRSQYGGYGQGGYGQGGYRSIS